MRRRHQGRRVVENNHGPQTWAVVGTILAIVVASVTIGVFAGRIESQIKEANNNLSRLAKQMMKKLEDHEDRIRDLEQGDKK